jgi:transcriptional regulator with XRE-family HTH domain
MPRPYSNNAGSKAGKLILAWARKRPPGALLELAEACEVNVRTLSRWISGEQEPRISDAKTIKKVAKVPLSAWPG